MTEPLDTSIAPAPGPAPPPLGTSRLVETPSRGTSPLRRLVYALLITVATAGICGRIATASLVYEPELHKGKYVAKGRNWPATPPRPMPTFSSNDRSRWATIRALVDEGTFAVGRRDRRTIELSTPTTLAAANPWEAATLTAFTFQVRAKGSDSGIIFEDGWQSVDKVLHPERLEFYSSKPPLLSVLIAGLYWLLQLCTGWTLEKNPFAVVRTILLLVNALPFALYLLVLARWVERLGTTDWGKLFVVTAGAFATLLTPFAVTLNNHSLAAYCVLFAMGPLLRMWLDDALPSPLALIGSGLLTGFAVTNELPAASFAAVVLFLLFWRVPMRTVLCFAPAVLVPIAAMLWLNQVALGQWRPAYSEFGGPWYEYEGSHWRSVPGQIRTGIDFAGNYESRAMYIVHCLIGHHGLFSLTPVWLFTLAALTTVCWRWFQGKQKPSLAQALLALMTGMLSVIVLGFYLTNRTVNYGGWTMGLRWLMWLSPLWLLAMLPTVDRLAASRWGRGLGYACLGLSVFSVAFAAWNPWRHPWIYQLMEALGWPGY